jgi:hypothetical protein
MQTLEPMLVPVKEFFRAVGLGPTAGWDAIKNGEVETVLRGTRRLVVVDSIKALVERWRADERANPKRRWSTETARQRNRASREVRESRQHVACE